MLFIIYISLTSNYYTMAFDKENTVGLQIKRLSSIFSRRVENLDGLKSLNEQLGTNAFILLHLVNHKNKTICQNDIKTRFGITKGTISKILSNLEQKEYISRIEIGNDKRKKQIIPTQKAIDVVNAIQDEIAEIDTAVTKDFTSEERAQFIEYLKRAIKNIEDKK